MNKKNTLIILCLLLFSQAVFGASISNLSVSPEPKLGQNVVVRGQFVSDSNAYRLCKFEAKDSSANFVERWSDEYTFADGTFYAERTLTEPPYFRGNDFNLVVTCGNTLEFGSAEGTFRVDNREDLAGFAPNAFVADIEWLTNTNNSLAIVFFLLALLFLGAVFAFYRGWFFPR